VAKWGYFAANELPKVIRELGIPCATPVRVTGMASCPRHQDQLGPVSRMCIRCHHEAWDEVGRRYAAQSRPVNRELIDPREVTMSPTEVVEGELLPDVYDPIEETPAPNTLFGTSDPKVALERMSDVASALMDVIKDRKLFARISGHEHITAEGWTTLGCMLGIVPVVVWTKPNETGDGYLARVEARTLNGRVVGAAESECSRAERKWKAADPYAIRSMAQTRAIGRALRAPLGQIAVLAGYEATPAEELSVADETPSPVRSIPSDEQEARISDLMLELQDLDDRDWGAWCRDYAGVASFNDLDEAGAQRLVSGLERVLRQRAEPEAPAA
jgi:hypothetical protein